jgi:hypothetical protein
MRCGEERHVDCPLLRSEPRVTNYFAKSSVTISPLLIGQVEQFYCIARDKVAAEDSRQGTVVGVNSATPHRSPLAIPAYILAAAAVEAFVNEMFLSPFALTSLDVFAHEAGLSGELTAEAESLEKLDLPTKLIRAPRLCTGRSLDPGKQPYQDVQLLADLRNELVHYKMGWRPPKAVRVLAQRGLAFRVRPEEEDGGPHPWADRVSTVEGIRWAYDTACKAGRALLDLLPDAKREGFANLRWNFRDLA